MIMGASLVVAGVKHVAYFQKVVVQEIMITIIINDTMIECKQSYLGSIFENKLHNVSNIFSEV